MEELPDEQRREGILSNHFLLSNKIRKNKTDSRKIMDLGCYLCNARGYELRTIYSCTICGKPFHVECFVCFHYPHLLEGEAKSIMEALEQEHDRIISQSVGTIMSRYDKRYNKGGRKSEYIKDISAIELPMDTPDKPLRKKGRLKKKNT